MFSGKYRKIIAPRETAREGPQASPSVPLGLSPSGQIFYGIFLKTWSIIIVILAVIYLSYRLIYIYNMYIKLLILEWNRRYKHESCNSHEWIYAKCHCFFVMVHFGPENLSLFLIVYLSLDKLFIRLIEWRIC